MLCLLGPYLNQHSALNCIFLYSGKAKCTIFKKKKKSLSLYYGSWTSTRLHLTFISTCMLKYLGKLPGFVSLASLLRAMLRVGWYHQTLSFAATSPTLFLPDPIYMFFIAGPSLIKECYWAALMPLLLPSPSQYMV